MTIGIEQTDRIIAVWSDHLEVAKVLFLLAPDTSTVVEIIYSSMTRDGQLLIVGNGGSAADAQHNAAELTGRFMCERRPLRALALNVDTSALMAVGNDYGYEYVFARELAAQAHPGDVLLALSISGSSPNILRAIEVARERKVIVIGFTGESGGQMQAMCDLCLRVPSKSTPRVQEMHIVIGHTVCQLLEQRLMGQ